MKYAKAEPLLIQSGLGIPWMPLMLFVLVCHPTALIAQTCAMTPLTFGIVAPGHVYHVDKLSSDAICFSSTTLTGRNLVRVGSIVPLTNGTDTISLTFGSTDGSIRYSTSGWSGPIDFDPIAGYTTPIATRGVAVRLGGSINVPFTISPGSYTGFVRVDIIRQ